ncbi:MAG TPA: hydrogenase maturation nickel metallochaperone HypA, partial [Vicinamibacteria bacterium]|nr:hydrogenase maturation nickel metallochaperone HypA [Vicinamibacteria bacterium]
ELIRLAEDAVPRGARVREVRASVGLLTGVSPEAMLFYFEALRDERLGPQAQLRVRLEPLQGRCGACGATAEIAEQSWLCPSCGEPRLVFENGDELTLAAVVLDDGESDHDRAEDPQEERRNRTGEPP